MTPRPFVQKILGVIAGIISSVFFLLFDALANGFADRDELIKLRIGILITVGLWIALLYGLQMAVKRVGYVSRDRLIQMYVTLAAFFALRLVIEVPFLTFFLTGMVGFFMALLLGWADADDQVMHVQKIIRRLVSGLWVFDAYAGMTVLFALRYFFQQQISYTFLSVAGAVMFALIAWMNWRLYFPDKKLSTCVLPCSMLALMMFELIWVMKYAPLGYLVLGAIVTWVWYVVQLFFRFNFTARGIVWKEQIVFLSINVLLYTGMLLFLVRWI